MLERTSREKKCLILFRDSRKINPRRNHDFDSYENTTIYIFADQAFNKLCYLEIQQWNSTMIAIFFLPLSLSQLLVISSSQSKGDERFFSLEIFLSVAINVANRNRISHFNIGEITVSFSINHHSCYINQSFAAIDLQKNYINNSKSTIRSNSNLQIYFAIVRQ